MYVSEIVGPLATVATLLIAYSVNENSAVFRWIERLGGRLPRTFHSTPREARGRVAPEDCEANPRGDRPGANGPSSAPGQPSTFWAFDVLDPRDAVTLGWGPNWLLVAWRAVPATYLALCLHLQVNLDGKPLGPEFLIFFTNWSLVLLSATGLWGWVATLYYSWTRAKPAWNFGTCGYVLLQQSSQCSGLFLTVFFWAALYPGGAPSTQDILKHGVNVVVLLIDTALSRTPVVSYHILFCFVPVVFFSFFMWIYFAVTGEFIYAPLAFSAPLSYVYYLAVPLMLTASFYIWFGLVYARESLIRARCHRSVPIGEATEMMSQAVVGDNPNGRDCDHHQQGQAAGANHSQQQLQSPSSGWSTVPL